MSFQDGSIEAPRMWFTPIAIAASQLPLEVPRLLDGCSLYAGISIVSAGAHVLSIVMLEPPCRISLHIEPQTARSHQFASFLQSSGGVVETGAAGASVVFSPSSKEVLYENVIGKLDTLFEAQTIVSLFPMSPIVSPMTMIYEQEDSDEKS